MTKQQDEWGPWIEHDGSPNPCPGMWVDTIDRLGQREEGMSDEFCETHDMSDCWDWSSPDFLGVQIICYRIRRPRGMEVLDKVLADLPQKVDA